MKRLLLLILSANALAEVNISPNMNLPVPVVGQTPGPAWADNINSCMGSIDSHDHTPGKGVPITPEGLDINSDLSLNGNSLIDTEAAIFASQGSFGTSQSLYVISPDLYYNDGNGNVIQITQGGSVAGASGTITGLPSGTASASYQSVGGTFRFQSATNTPANISGANIVISEQVASVTPNAITIKSPTSLAASYSLTLPTAVPSATSLLTMSSSGALATVGYKAPTQQRFTSSSGTYTTPTNPSPLYIKVRMIGGGGAGGSRAGNAGGPGADTTFGSSLLTAGGGGGGSTADSGSPAGGAGGSATINSPAFGTAVTGGRGGMGTGQTNSTTAVYLTGGQGASSPFASGGPGADFVNDTDGYAGGANTGTGGGGAGNSHSGSGSHSAPCGGGAGGYIEAYINSPSASYSYSVGAGGTTSGPPAGGAGGSGYIEVTEFYQ